jgi:hypothetical protein
MGVDLSKIPTKDLEYISAGQLDKVSTATLEYISKQQATPKENIPASQVIPRAISNLPSSTMNVFGGLYEAVTNPIQTGKAILDVAAGGLQNILPESLVKAVGEDKASREAANRVGQAYVERYGGIENAKRTIANDPAGFMADVATILTAGSPMSPRLATAASFVDPVSLTVKAGVAATKGAGKVAAPVFGASTGVGSDAITEAFAAGKAGGKKAEQFRENITGSVPFTDVLDTVKQNLANMNTAKQQQYRSGMVDIKNDNTVLSFTGIDKAIADAASKTEYKGKVVNPKAAQKLSEVRQIVDDWKKENPADYHTPEGIDALKQKVGDVLEGIPFEEKRARSAVLDVYNSIKRQIVNQAPTYSKVMKDYSEASDLIKEIERSLSLGKKSSADTALRKLQSIMRNNVNTNYGQRAEMLRLLNESGTDVSSALAGQALSDVVPRGIQRATSLPTSLGAFSLGGLPAAVASMAASSPRIVGETSFGLGLLSQGAGRAAREMPLAFDPRTYNLLYQSGQIKDQ